jgi:putative alpha-1,2-mannosidase
LFKNAVIHLENGNDIVIKAENKKDEKAPQTDELNVFISEMKFNKQLWNENFIKYSHLMNGAKLEYLMQDTPNYDRGALSK